MTTLHRSILALALIPTVALTSFAATTEPASESPQEKNTSEKTHPANPPKPLVKKISEHVYQIGKITFHKNTREITFDTQTNIIDPGTPLEFVLVHLNGEKAHEALLVTEADPTHLNIALKLLDYQESQELFRPINEDGTRGEEYQKESDETRKAARFTIHITWDEKGQKKTAPITSWLQNRLTNKPMPNVPWVYNGSYIHANKFNAKLNGNYFAILPNESAIATYFGTDGVDRYDDTLWLPIPNLPAEGTKVTVTLKPWSGSLKPQKLK